MRIRRLVGAVAIALALALAGALVAGCDAGGSDMAGGATSTVAATAVASTPSGPSLELGPTGGAVDRQEVTVSGSGFSTPGSVWVVQCRRDAADLTGCEAPAMRTVELAADGTFRASLTVRQVLITASGAVDCSAPDACEVLAALPSDGSTSVSVPISVGASPSTTTPEAPEPPCPGPYPPIDHYLGSDPASQPPPWGTTPQIPSSRTNLRFATIVEGDAVLVTVELGGVVRRFTTAPYPLGGNYDRSYGPGETKDGADSAVTDEDGAVYVVLEQGTSGSSTRVAWLVDDPCGA